MNTEKSIHLQIPLEDNPCSCPVALHLHKFEPSQIVVCYYIALALITSARSDAGYNSLRCLTGNNFVLLFRPCL